MRSFLDIPNDRPEEAQVRDKLLDALDQLPLWDRLGEDKLPLSLVREFIHDHLEAIAGRQGEYAAGGVTIAALRQMRPMPFSIIYILGLGEDIFPGSDRLSSFDLRDAARVPGDVRPAELARFQFLETLLAARKKVYLLHNNKDVQKDQDLLPAVPVVQLERYLSRHVLTTDFAGATVPLHGHDPAALTRPMSGAHDIGCHVSETDRLLAVVQAKENHAIVLDIYQEGEFKERLKRRQPDFSLPSGTAAGPEAASVTIRELSDFLRKPGLAALKHHLHLDEDRDDDNESPDDEPLVSSFFTALHITKQVLQGIVQDWARGSLEEALRLWPERFDQLHEEEGLRCRTPADGFGAADQDFLRAELAERINGSLVGFLRQREPSTFCGPVLLGTSPTPVGARRRFPALTLSLPRIVPGRNITQVRVSGHQPLVWADAGRFEILVLTNKKELRLEKVLSSYLFEPVLFYLALLANADARQNEPSARDWLRSRRLCVHVSCKHDLHSYDYDLAAEEAAAYLGVLSADFFDPTAFDLLPFELIAGDGKKPGQPCDAYIAADEDAAEPADYVERLQDEIAGARENDFGAYRHSPLLDLAKATVPPDAWAKIRRRFRLLDRAPAKLRAAN
jgi:hypothetical protein